MRISKEKAEKVAIAVTHSLAKKIDAAKESLRIKALEYAEAQIPKDVAECFAKHSEYFHAHSKGNFRGIGIPNYTYIALGKQLPGYSNSVELSAIQSRVIVKLLDAVGDLEKNYEDAKLKITNTLIGLGTYNRIKEQLPEVVKYLPAETTTAVMLPIKEVRAEIKKLTLSNQ